MNSSIKPSHSSSDVKNEIQSKEMDSQQIPILVSSAEILSVLGS